MAHLLIADDEIAIRRYLDRLLAAHGHEIEQVESGEAALEAVRLCRPDLVLLDVQMSGISGIATLERLGRDAPGLPVIIMTAETRVDTAVAAFKLGAVDFVNKPFDEQKLLAAVEAALPARPSSVGLPRGPVMIGEAPRFREAMDLALKYARPDINILLQGETGTGKELFARTIHLASKRSDFPFVPVDCSILSESLIESELFGHEKGAFTGATSSRIGHFERANHGTLFLDEIGNLSLPFQAKLLRVLQERTLERVGGRETIKLDIRVIAATHVNLREAIDRGTFRKDLYYRLSEMTIATPSLAARTGDVRRLAEFFSERYAAAYEHPQPRISPEAMRLLESHDWPGNVRELENVIKSAVIVAEDMIMPRHLPAHFADHAPASVAPVTVQSPSPSQPGGRSRFQMHIEVGRDDGSLDLKELVADAGEQAERHILQSVMAHHHLSFAQLAKLLVVDPKTLRAKLRKHGLHEAD